MQRRALLTLAALPGVRRAEVVLEDHFASDVINDGVAAQAGFVQTFDGEAVSVVVSVSLPVTAGPVGGVPAAVAEFLQGALHALDTALIVQLRARKVHRDHHIRLAL